MSDLSQSVQIMLTARGINLKGNTDDLTTMINQGVIKAEGAARRKALEEMIEKRDAAYARALAYEQACKQALDLIKDLRRGLRDNDRIRKRLDSIDILLGDK